MDIYEENFWDDLDDVVEEICIAALRLQWMFVIKKEGGGFLVFPNII
jgi:hypothetical protein